MSNPITDFYDVIWTFEKGEETIDALFSGELTIDSYAEMLYQKRKAFETYVMDMIFKGGDCSILEKILGRLPPQLERNPNFYEEVIPLKGTREYCEYEYHNIRYKEISIAVKNTYELLKGKKYEKPIFFPPKKVVDLNEILQDTNDIVNQYHYNCLYSDEQLEEIYRILIMRGYMDGNTDFDDFVYYMTGKGELPTNGLCWLKDNDELAYFISAFCPCHKKYKIGEIIFGRKRLSSAYYQSQKEDIFRKLRKTIDK